MEGVLSVVFGAVASCAAVHMGFAFFPGFEQWLHSTGASLAYNIFGIQPVPHVHAAFAGAATGVSAPAATAGGHFCAAEAFIPPAPAVPTVSPGGQNVMDLLGGPK